MATAPRDLIAFDAPAAVSQVTSLSTVSTDNRLRVFDIVSGKQRQVYTEPNHLSAQYTCIAFISVPDADHLASKSQKRKAGSGYSIGVCALGTAQGEIVIWHLQTAEIIHRLGSTSSESSSAGAGHSGRVHDVVFNDQGTVLYSCGEDKRILEWNVVNGQLIQELGASKTEAATKLCLNPDNSFLISAGTTIKLWDLSSKKTIQRYSGHASAAACLAFSPDGRYFLSGAGDRYVSLWSTQPVSDAKSSKKESKQRHIPAIHTFPLQAKPVALHFNPVFRKGYVFSSDNFACQDLGDHFFPSSQSNNKDSKSSKLNAVNNGDANALHIAAVDERGSVSIWQYSPSSSSSASSSISNSSSNSDNAMSIDSTSSAADCQIVPLFSNSEASNSATDSGPVSMTGQPPAKRGKRLTGQNMSAPVLQQEGGVIAARFLSKNTILVARYAALRPVFQHVTYLKEHNGDVVKQIELQAVSSASLMSADADVQEPSRKKIKINSLPTIAHATPMDSSEDSKAPKQQLKPSSELSASISRLSKSSSSLADKLAKEKKETEAKASIIAASSAMATPQAGSLQTILTQALQSSDDALLEYCLNSASGNQSVIIKTIQRLPANYILTFLKKVLGKFQKKPNRGLYLVQWIKAVLNTHTSYLLSIPELAASLSALYQTVDTRLAVFKKLLQLNGRLDLLLSQANKRFNSGNSLSASQGPLLVYNEDEEEPRAAEEKKQSAKKAGKSKSGKNNAENADDAELEISDEEEDEVEENDDAEMDPSLDVDEQVLQALDDLSSEADEA